MHCVHFEILSLAINGVFGSSMEMELLSFESERSSEVAVTNLGLEEVNCSHFICVYVFAKVSLGGVPVPIHGHAILV
jgi:hypothetical protein